MAPTLALVLAGILVLVVAAVALASSRRRTDRPPRRHAPPVASVAPVAPPASVPTSAPAATTASRPASAPAAPLVPAPPTTPGGMRARLARTRDALAGGLADAFGRGVSDEAFDRLEEALIAADVGVVATREVVAEVRARCRTSQARDLDAVRAVLADVLVEGFADDVPTLARRGEGTTVWLVAGVNGAGKTTTIGKLAAREVALGRTVVVAAADTFRAAAADQLAVWAQRSGATLVRKDEGADPAAVAFEAAETARAAGADLLIVDTAGRLHTRQTLMDELGKVARVLGRQAEGVDETLLVLDGTTGQNGIVQARAFLEAIAVTGVVLTKLDGSSRGGIVVAVRRELGLPVRLVGLGEGVDDLVEFDARRFVEGLLAP